MAERKQRITWRVPVQETGLARVAHGRTNGCDICVNGKRVIYIRESHSRWYWYGIRTNTIADGLTFATLDDARFHAKQALVKYLEAEHAAD